ncbi:MAG: ABC transporter permease subunit [Bacilli bacterium]|nr:ABC transporter permease subunit [Bacilli bacterium]
MKKFISNKYFLTLIGIILFLGLWALIAAIIHEPILIFPGPIDTIKYSFKLLGQPETYLHIGYSVLRLLIGFLISAVLALILGLIVGNFKKSGYVFKPTIIALKTIPTAALVLLLLSAVGASNTPIYVVAVICFPILFEAVAGGIGNIDPQILFALKVDGQNFFIENIKVKIPLAAPYIVVGMASSFALSFKIEIMSEVIAGSTGYGLGSAISKASTGSDMLNKVPLFSYAFIAILLALLTSFLSFGIKKIFAYKKKRAS